MVKISVIMLTYNREKFVDRAIESVLDQDFTDFELILVDNGSTDRSGEICDGFATQDRRIRVIHRKRGNIGSGRNAGLDAASGEYVTFVDDDDVCLPDFLSSLYFLAREHGADVATVGSYKNEDGVQQPNGAYLYDGLYVMGAAEAVENYLWRKLYNCAMPTKLVRRTMFDEIRFSGEGAYDDISTTYKYFAEAEKVVAWGAPKYVFYRHPGNNSSAATKHHLLNPGQLAEYIKAFRERTEYIAHILPDLKPLARYSEWSYMISMVEKIHRFGLAECQAVQEQMCEKIRANKEEFLNGGFIQDFEREWVEKFAG